MRCNRRSFRVRNNNKPARATRQAAATERQTERDKRSPQDQLKVLDFRLGANQGAKKERLKLAKRQLPKEEVVVTEGQEVPKKKGKRKVKAS